MSKSKTKEKKNWLASIVERSGCDRFQVEDVLTKGRIQASPVSAAPKRLLLKDIRFSGEKHGIESGGAFAFEWLGLEQGLWGLVSDNNLKGKTSVFEITRWLLKGQRSSNLQEDVKGWIKEASLRFSIDEVDYLVHFEIDEEHENLGGTLSRFTKDEKKRKVGSFDSEDEFADTMSDFFMRQFSIDPIPIYRNKQNGSGSTTLHDWPAVAGVLFIGTNYDTLLGELPFTTGLPPKLLQIFLGLPWISTHTAINAYLRECRKNVEAEEAFNEKQRESRVDRIKDLGEELQAKRNRLKKVGGAKNASTELKNATEKLSENKDAEVSLLSRLALAKDALSRCETAYQDDQRELQIHVDSTAANAVFRALNPTCCPRCDKEISVARRNAEAETNSCSVCGKKVSSDEDAAVIEKELRLRLKASQKSKRESKKALKLLEKEQVTLREDATTLEKSIRKLSKQLGQSGERVQLEKEIAVVEARLEELEGDEAAPSQQEQTVRILEAAEKETKERFESTQKEILEAVSTRIVEFSNRFGMTLLTRASLKANLNLSLVKGGEQTSYSKVTPGEQLRLKVATVLALISVGEEHGVGRYPGILLIDSPGNNELVASDLDQLIAGLEDLASQFEHLQVFIASIASKAVLKHLADDHLIRAKKDDPIW